MAKLKGMCRNEDCEMCDQIQEAEKSNFKCEKCGKDLIPFGNNKGTGGGPNKKLIGIIVGVVVVLAIIGGILAFGGGEEQPEVVEKTGVAAPPADEKDKPYIEVPVTESEPQVDEPSQPDPQTPMPTRGRSRGTVDLGYATYSGDLLDGKPDGAGVLTFKSGHSAGRNYETNELVNAVANEYIDGNFTNGKVQVGTLHQNNGNTIKVKD